MKTPTFALVAALALLTTNPSHAGGRYPTELAQAEQKVATWVKQLAHKSKQDVEALLGAPDERTTWSANGHEGPKLVYHFSPSVDLQLLMIDDHVSTVLYMHRLIQ